MDSENWCLYEGETLLKPLCFSNGKSQEDIVGEVLTAVKNGKRKIFIHGVCGTGKSAIALNIARALGKAAIVVPIKNLQKQYEDDYSSKKHLYRKNILEEIDSEKFPKLSKLKNNKEKLKISVITGRNNHKCKFLEQKNSFGFIKREINSTLKIFEGVKKKEEKISKDISANNDDIPCKIEIREKNWQKLRDYFMKNKEIDSSEISSVKDVKRATVAPVCPYWCPVLPEEYEFKQPSIANAKKFKFEGVNGKKYIYYQRKEGCGYYGQFKDYIESDVLVFNSMKYKLESILGRKPKTAVDIIDECDEFLDSFSNTETIDLKNLQNSLTYAWGESEIFDRIHKELTELILALKNSERINDASFGGNIIPLKETGLFDFLKILLKNPEFFDELDEESYLFEVLEIAQVFSGFYEDTYLTVEKKEDVMKLNLVTTNLAKMFELLVGKNEVVVMMSGTLHSKDVLKKIFGLENFEVIEAEVENQGRIEVVRTGLEFDCKYSNFSSGKKTRNEYLKALDKCVELAQKPTLVHVQAFKDLPSEEEIIEFDLENLISREKLREIQIEKGGKLIRNFKEKKIDVLFSTRASRGIDFPGDECKSIIFTKYPNPNVQNAFWKILNKTHPQDYWDFYRDKARRELWQKVYRGVRFSDDHVFVLSPDVRVLDVFEK